MSPHWIKLLMIIISVLTFSYDIASSQPLDFPIAKLSTTWINSVSARHSVEYYDNTTIRIILLRSGEPTDFGCGFYCNGDCETYVLAIFYLKELDDGQIDTSIVPEIVWSANRNNPIQINATLQFTGEGDLVLRDADGTLAWSTNTSGMPVAGMNLTAMENLVLFDDKDLIVWQSFDHPTDTLVPGQRLMAGQNLTASVSPTNWSGGGMYALSITDDGLVASIQLDHDPPLPYYGVLGLGAHDIQENGTNNKETSYAVFGNGTIRLYLYHTPFLDPNITNILTYIPRPTSAQYIRLDPEGHLRVYDWGSRSNQVYDVIAARKGSCGYPMVCGKYGVCSNGQCSCPSSSYFRPLNERQPNLGCSEITALTCNNSTYNHTFLDLEDVTYFTFTPHINGTNANGCKEACSRSCSCKAAILRYDGFATDRGDCYLAPQVLSFIRKGDGENRYGYYNAFVSVKVQMPAGDGVKHNNLGPILGSTIGTVFVVAVVCVLVFVLRRKNVGGGGAEGEDDCLEYFSGMPTRFSYEDLVVATDNFSKKLGEGGFGSVFEGCLKDGTEIAVKRLDGMGHVKKSFLAEVETIGSIHHVNLVKLIGFCTKQSQRLLVYEYMCNGSLDRWIYSKTESERPFLDWKCRRNIILDIAKGLAYLHEECRHKIIHLDIKPQNILLDENFKARVADFGLSKLIDRNQHEVVTTMRGTPGYLAPEWLSAVITEKVDVYSFGVVILEILCGRKNFDQSQPEEQRHLLSLFKRKAEEGTWMDIADSKFCEGAESMDVVESELVEMMVLAAWCLQNDYSNRPSMSMVIKVMEGVETVPRDSLDYNFMIPHVLSNRTPEVGSEIGEFTSLLPSVLSGPR